MSNHALETKARWDRLAKHYGLVEFLSEWYLKPFRKALWARAEGRILEAGAGTGLNIGFYPAEARVTATDLSGAMLRRARERAREQNIDVTFEEADLCSLPFADRPSIRPWRPLSSAPCRTRLRACGRWAV